MKAGGVMCHQCHAGGGWGGVPSRLPYTRCPVCLQHTAGSRGGGTGVQWMQHMGAVGEGAGAEWRQARDGEVPLKTLARIPWQLRGKGGPFEPASQTSLPQLIRLWGLGPRKAPQKVWNCSKKILETKFGQIWLAAFFSKNLFLNKHQRQKTKAALWAFFPDTHTPNSHRPPSPGVAMDRPPSLQRNIASPLGMPWVTGQIGPRASSNGDAAYLQLAGLVGLAVHVIQHRAHPHLQAGLTVPTL